MTINEKTTLIRFIDTVLNYFRSGYSSYNDGEIQNKDASALPLAFQVDENDIDENEDVDAEYNDSLEKIAEEAETCKNCSLCQSRNKIVPGEGVLNPLVMVIGEGPGATEDAVGKPFVGKAGSLLDLMLKAINLSRDKNCYIANTVKCRPPNNREPLPEEIEACSAFLDRQIKLLKPRLILCAGKTAAFRILKSSSPLSRIRSSFGEYKGIPVLPTYHPSALLQNENYKRPAWEDLKLLKAKLISLSDDYEASFI